ncbi:MAG: MFS transporter [Verrucomicrobiales bacterium]|nr:MFS transporter [Verrucomicrobiales bacterium]
MNPDPHTPDPEPTPAASDPAPASASPAGDVTNPPVTRREVFGWACYDVADSAFTTVIVTVLYASYFGKVVVGDTGRADLLWGLGASISEIIVAVLAPILGAIADYSGSRKKFLAACAVTIVFFTACLGFVGPGMATMGLALYILANVGFAGGGVFIDSFLPGISNESNAGRISGLKWAMGYGSGLLALFLCLPLAANIVANPTPEQLAKARLIPWIVAAYYAVAVIPTFLFLRDRSVPQPLPPGRTYLTVGFHQLADTFRNIRRYKELGKLLVAFLVYNDGVVTVIAFAARYATDTIGFTTSDVTVLFIGLNVVALVGALAFGRLADAIGQKRTILISLVLWVVALFVAYFSHSKATFYVVGFLAGLGIGSTQSVTRSLVALFTPKERAAEFYGFLGIAGKALAFLGPLLFGFLSRTTGSQRPALLSIGIFFVVGGILLWFVDEKAGKAASKSSSAA